jgi:uncharacterized SAM-binding protein YcdF (DUF218 family)
VTGGKIRKNAPTEADMGKNYLKNKIRIPTILEKRAKTTIENIKYVKELINKRGRRIEKLAVITSKKRIFKIKYLYKRLWPELKGKIEFHGAKDFYPAIFSLWERISLISNAIDINEKFVHRITKRFFRS